MGGNPIPWTSLHHLLRNPVYIGDLTYRGERYPGIHQPIIGHQLWKKAQDLLAERKPRSRHNFHNLLTGLLFDENGRRMNAHEHRNGPHLSRYYESALFQWAIRQGIRKARVRADAIEQLVLTAIRELLRDRPALRVMLMRIGVLGPVNDRLTALGSTAAVRLVRMPADHLSLALKSLTSRVELTPQLVRLLLRAAVIARFLQWDGRGMFRVEEFDLGRATDLHFVEIPAALTTMRCKPYIPVVPRRPKAAEPNRALVKLIDQARDAQRLVFSERDRTLSELAHLKHMRPAGFGRLVRLNYLAPDIVAAILDGEQPEGLTREQLLRFDLPIDWKMQRALLGFADKPELTFSEP